MLTGEGLVSVKEPFFSTWNEDSEASSEETFLFALRIDHVVS
jgi:hypothetical protein